MQSAFSKRPLYKKISKTIFTVFLLSSLIAGITLATSRDNPTIRRMLAMMDEGSSSGSGGGPSQPEDGAPPRQEEKTSSRNATGCLKRNSRGTCTEFRYESGTTVRSVRDPKTGGYNHEVYVPRASGGYNKYLVDQKGNYIPQGTAEQIPSPPPTTSSITPSNPIQAGAEPCAEGISTSACFCTTTNCYYNDLNNQTHQVAIGSQEYESLMTALLNNRIKESYSRLGVDENNDNRPDAALTPDEVNNQAAITRDLMQGLFTQLENLIISHLQNNKNINYTDTQNMCENQAAGMGISSSACNYFTETQFNSIVNQFNTAAARVNAENQFLTEFQKWVMTQVIRGGETIIDYQRAFDICLQRAQLSGAPDSACDHYTQEIFNQNLTEAQKIAEKTRQEIQNSLVSTIRDWVRSGWITSYQEAIANCEKSGVQDCQNIYTEGEFSFDLKMGAQKSDPYSQLPPFATVEVPADWKSNVVPPPSSPSQGTLNPSLPDWYVSYSNENSNFRSDIIDPLIAQNPSLTPFLLAFAPPSTLTPTETLQAAMGAAAIAIAPLALPIIAETALTSITTAVAAGAFSLPALTALAINLAPVLSTPSYALTSYFVASAFIEPTQAGLSPEQAGFVRQFTIDTIAAKTFSYGLSVSLQSLAATGTAGAIAVRGVDFVDNLDDTITAGQCLATGNYNDCYETAINLAIGPQDMFEIPTTIARGVASTVGVDISPIAPSGTALINGYSINLNIHSQAVESQIQNLTPPSIPKAEISTNLASNTTPEIQQPSVIISTTPSERAVVTTQGTERIINEVTERINEINEIQRRINQDLYAYTIPPQIQVKPSLQILQNMISSNYSGIPSRIEDELTKILPELINKATYQNNIDTIISQSNLSQETKSWLSNFIKSEIKDIRIWEDVGVQVHTARIIESSGLAGRKESQEIVNALVESLNNDHIVHPDTIKTHLLAGTTETPPTRNPITSGLRIAASNTQHLINNLTNSAVSLTNSISSSLKQAFTPNPKVEVTTSDKNRLAKALEFIKTTFNKIGSNLKSSISKIRRDISTIATNLINKSPLSTTSLKLRYEKAIKERVKEEIKRDLAQYSQQKLLEEIQAYNRSRLSGLYTEQQIREYLKKRIVRGVLRDYAPFPKIQEIISSRGRYLSSETRSKLTLEVRDEIMPEWNKIVNLTTEDALRNTDIEMKSTLVAPRIVAFGDVHGDLENVIQLLSGHLETNSGRLTNPAIVQKNGQWVVADDTVVITTGDIFDRTPQDLKGTTIKTLDFLMQLQERSGYITLENGVRMPRFIVLLGNHDAAVIYQLWFYYQASNKSLLDELGFVPTPLDLHQSPGITPQEAKFILNNQNIFNWLINLPALFFDPTTKSLYMHSDTTNYLKYGKSVSEINQRIKTILSNREGVDAIKELVADLSDREKFMTRDKENINKILALQPGAEKIIHGHTPDGMSAFPDIVTNVDYQLSRGFANRPHPAGKFTEKEAVKITILKAKIKSKKNTASLVARLVSGIGKAITNNIGKLIGSIIILAVSFTIGVSMAWVTLVNNGQNYIRITPTIQPLVEIVSPTVNLPPTLDSIPVPVFQFTPSGSRPSVTPESVIPNINQETPPTQEQVQEMLAPVLDIETYNKKLKEADFQLYNDPKYLPYFKEAAEIIKPGDTLFSLLTQTIYNTERGAVIDYTNSGLGGINSSWVKRGKRIYPAKDGLIGTALYRQDDLRPSDDLLKKAALWIGIDPESPDIRKDIFEAYHHPEIEVAAKTQAFISSLIFYQGYIQYGPWLAPMEYNSGRSESFIEQFETIVGPGQEAVDIANQVLIDFYRARWGQAPFYGYTFSNIEYSRKESINEYGQKYVAQFASATTTINGKEVKINFFQSLQYLMNIGGDYRMGFFERYNKIIYEQNLQSQNIAGPQARSGAQTIMIMGDSIAQSLAGAQSQRIIQENSSNQYVFVGGQISALPHEAYRGATAQKYYQKLQEGKIKIGSQNIPSMVIIQLGTNDLASGQVSSEEDIQGKFINFYENIIAYLQNINPEIKILIMPVPESTKPWGYLVPNMNLALKNMVGEINENRTNPKFQVILVNQGEPILTQDLVSEDGIHPSTVGISTMSEVVRNYILDIIGEQPSSYNPYGPQVVRAKPALAGSLLLGLISISIDNYLNKLKTSITKAIDRVFNPIKNKIINPKTTIEQMKGPTESSSSQTPGRSTLLGSGPAQLFENISQKYIYSLFPGSQEKGVLPVIWESIERGLGKFTSSLQQFSKRTYLELVYTWQKIKFETRLISSSKNKDKIYALQIWLFSRGLPIITRLQTWLLSRGVPVPTDLPLYSNHNLSVLNLSLGENPSFKQEVGNLIELARHQKIHPLAMASFFASGEFIIGGIKPTTELITILNSNSYNRKFENLVLSGLYKADPIYQFFIPNQYRSFSLTDQEMDDLKRLTDLLISKGLTDKQICATIHLLHSYLLNTDLRDLPTSELKKDPFSIYDTFLRIIEKIDPNLNATIYPHVAGNIYDILLLQDGEFNNLLPYFKVAVQEYPNFENTPVLNKIINEYTNLERQQPGITQFLREKLGIYFLFRYGFDNRNLEEITKFYHGQSENKRYGIFLFARHNWNGAFNHSSSYLHPLMERLSENGYQLIIIEASTKTEFLKTLLSLERQLGGKRPSFLLIAAHGAEKNFQLGTPPINSKNQGKYFVTIEDLASTATQKLKERYYEKSMPFGLISCSTGVECGITQEFSKTFGSFAIGPDSPTNVLSISPVFDSEKNIIGFYITYTTATAKGYLSGKKFQIDTRDVVKPENEVVKSESIFSQPLPPASEEKGLLSIMWGNISTQFKNWITSRMQRLWDFVIYQKKRFINLRYTDTKIIIAQLLTLNPRD